MLKFSHIDSYIRKSYNCLRVLFMQNRNWRGILWKKKSHRLLSEECQDITVI